MYRRSVSLVFNRLSLLPHRSVLPSTSQSQQRLKIGRGHFFCSQISADGGVLLKSCMFSTSGHHYHYYNHNQHHRRKSCSNNDPGSNIRDVTRNPYLAQRRFFNKDAKLTEDDLTEEELEVLAELEREQAKIKAEKAKQLSIESTKPEKERIGNSLRQSVSQEFVPFENQQRVIQDVIEEMWNPLPKVETVAYEPPEEFLERGKTGVFDLGELVDLLREENSTEVVAITLPKEVDYADHMLIVTARSPRHLMALAVYVRKRYKLKNRKTTDVIPKIISEDILQGWIALDLGNIILHIFLQTQRDFYDLELLWTVGPLFDDLSNVEDPEIIQLLNMMK